jgi:hypothetical protein
MNAENSSAKFGAVCGRYFLLDNSPFRAKARIEPPLHYPGLKAGAIEYPE